VTLRYVRVGWCCSLWLFIYSRSRLTTCKPPSGDILQRGGSAVDGAIAALLCTSVINPQSMGIGGGPYSRGDKQFSCHVPLFISKAQSVPQEFNPDLLSGCPQIFQLMTASQWIGVPGEIHGYEQADWLFGKLPWASFFHTTIKLAREGFHVPQVLSHLIPLINRDETLPLRQLFIDKDGNQLKVGDTVKFDKFADTLKIVTNQGADAFYTGKVAEDLICNVKDILKASWRPDNMHSHLLITSDLSCKFSNGLRKYFRPFPSFDQKALKLTEQQFADHFRAMFSGDETHDAQYNIVTPYPDTMGTTHVSVMAEDRTAESVICIINHMFGSRVFSPKTSIIFNNEFSYVCGNADHNPPSSMSAVVLQSKYKTLVIGGSGGSMITTGMALVSDHGINYIGSTYTLYICKYIEPHNNKYLCNTQLLYMGPFVKCNLVKKTLDFTSF
uniref:Gamma-glutamyltransferase 5a n=1 Tax=Salmo trutta TaxID=8032 RepID=A0A673YLX5_SALTR